MVHPDSPFSRLALLPLHGAVDLNSLSVSRTSSNTQPKGAGGHWLKRTAHTDVPYARASPFASF